MYIYILGAHTLEQRLWGSVCREVRTSTDETVRGSVACTRYLRGDAATVKRFFFCQQQRSRQQPAGSERTKEKTSDRTKKGKNARSNEGTHEGASKGTDARTHALTPAAAQPAAAAPSNP